MNTKEKLELINKFIGESKIVFIDQDGDISSMPELELGEKFYSIYAGEQIIKENYAGINNFEYLMNGKIVDYEDLEFYDTKESIDKLLKQYKEYLKTDKGEE